MIRYAFLICAAMACGCLDITVTEDNDGYMCGADGEFCEPLIPQPDASPSMRDVCTVVGTTNFLSGTCWMEQCRDGEKSLFAKTAGTPCIYKPTNGGTPWVEGVCNGEGACD